MNLSANHQNLELRITRSATLITVFSFLYIIVFTEGNYGFFDIFIGGLAIWFCWKFRTTMTLNFFDTIVFSFILGSAVVASAGGINGVFVRLKGESIPLEIPTFIQNLSFIFDVTYMDLVSFILSSSIALGLLTRTRFNKRSIERKS